MQNYRRCRRRNYNRRKRFDKRKTREHNRKSTFRQAKIRENEIESIKKRKHWSNR